MIETLNLDLNFASRKILNDVSVSFKQGRIYCLLGENGAGKSTFLKSLAGHYPAAFEKVFIEKQSLSYYTRSLNLYKKLMFLPQSLTAAENFTCREFLATNFIRDSSVFLSREDKIDVQNLVSDAIHEWKLDLISTKQLNTLSGGEWRRTQLALSFMRRRSLLILDEPDAHLDLKFIRMLAEYCRNYVFDGTRSIIMATHNFDFAQSVATDFLLVKDGKIKLVEQSDNFVEMLQELFEIHFETVETKSHLKRYQPCF